MVAASLGLTGEAEGWSALSLGLTGKAKGWSIYRLGLPVRLERCIRSPRGLTGEGNRRATQVLMLTGKRNLC